jgi:branched-subunit amino acid aminotransferase/4-amino-4-deoxychorismate lyase
MDNGSFKSEISMINYNGKLKPSDSVTFGVSNRGFQYGDGVFETIIYDGNKIKFIEEHWDRIFEGIKALKMELPFTKSGFEVMIMDLLKSNDLLGRYTRIKLIAWRKTGGLYTPTESEAEYLLTLKETEKNQIRNLQNVEIACSVFLQKSAFSHLKTISALPYVLAGIEKRDRQLEEIILTDENGYIAEASSANIYFLDFENRKIYTPSLDTGCINGVSRRFLFKNADKFGFKIAETMIRPEELSFGFSIYAINVAGISCIHKIGRIDMARSQKGLEILEEVFK